MNLKTKKIMIALLFGLSFIFISCENQDLSISDIQYRIDTVSIYKLNGNSKFDLIEQYPNLSLGVKVSNSNQSIVNMILRSPNEMFNWEFTPKNIVLNDEELLGVDNLNLASNTYEIGSYALKVLSSDGKEIHDSFFLDNNYRKKNLYIYINNKHLYFSNSEINDFSISENAIQTESADKFDLYYYNKGKDLISNNSYENYFNQTNYSFSIPINDLNSTNYIRINYTSQNQNNIIYIDLSSSNSLL